MSVALGAALASLAGGAPTYREIIRKKPTRNNVKNTADTMIEQGLDPYVKRIAPDNPINEIDEVYYPAADVDPVKALLGKSYASAGRGKETGNPSFAVPEMADQSILAHELGHIAFGQTPFGSAVQGLRSNSPALRNALIGAGVLAPGLIAAATPGDDDLAAGLAVSSALALPTIIDEFEASRHGLGIMNEAGLQITPGTRPRYAGALLTYAAAPVIAAAGGNALGNMFDGQSPGEILPN